MSAVALRRAGSGFGCSPASVRGVRGISGSQLWCGSGDCDIAEGRVTALRALFDQLHAAGKVETQAWAPAIVALEQALDDALPPYLLRGFGGCCNAVEIGRRADDLAARMAKAAGVERLPGHQDEDDNSVKWLGWGIAAGVVLVLLAIAGVLKVKGVA
jgi:hypothetical protein